MTLQIWAPGFFLCAEWLPSLVFVIMDLCLDGYVLLNRFHICDMFEVQDYEIPIVHEFPECRVSCSCLFTLHFPDMPMFAMIFLYNEVMSMYELNFIE